MSILGIIILAVFVLIAILLVLLVLIQNEEGEGLGGIFAGGSGSAFGSRSGNVLTRTTSVLGALFLLFSFGMAFLNREADISGVERAGLEQQAEQDADWIWDTGANSDSGANNQTDWNLDDTTSAADSTNQGATE